MRKVVFLAIFATISYSTNSVNELVNPNITVCGILHSTKCEWPGMWNKTEGIHRKLYSGSIREQWYYFCKGKHTEDNCEKWIDERGVPVEGSSITDKLTGSYFVIDNIDVNVTGDYYKIPVESPEIRLVIE